MEFAKIDAEPSHEVEGPEITVVHVTQKEELRTWMDQQIESLGCGAENLKIMHESYHSNEKLLEQLKKRYDEETEQLTQHLKKDNPKNDENMIKKQAQKQALDEVKKSLIQLLDAAIARM